MSKPKYNHNLFCKALDKRLPAEFDLLPEYFSHEDAVKLTECFRPYVNERLGKKDTFWSPQVRGCVKLVEDDNGKEVLKYIRGRYLPFSSDEMYQLSINTYKLKYCGSTPFEAEEKEDSIESVLIPKARRGRPAGAKNKKKEVIQAAEVMIEPVAAE